MGTTEATTALSSSGLDPADSVFAYSPLAAIADATYVQNFPADLTATYDGTTIARGGDAGSTYSQGSIKIDVTWAAGLADAAIVGRISASITDLRNSGGASYRSGGNAVESIQFTADDINVARNLDTSVLFFDSGTTATQLRYADPTIAASDADATLGGIFVAKVIDGPLAAIGNLVPGKQKRRRPRRCVWRGTRSVEYCRLSPSPPRQRVLRGRSRPHVRERAGIRWPQPCYRIRQQLSHKDFPRTDSLAAWAGLCPGNHESVGKRRSGRARQGNRHLRVALAECAHGAVRTKGTQFSGCHNDLAAHRGCKRAILAAANKLLRTICVVLRNDDHYRDRGIDYGQLQVQRNALAGEAEEVRLPARDPREHPGCLSSPHPRRGAVLWATAGTARAARSPVRRHTITGRAFARARVNTIGARVRSEGFTAIDLACSQAVSWPPVAKLNDSPKR